MSRVLYIRERPGKTQSHAETDERFEEMLTSAARQWREDGERATHILFDSYLLNFNVGFSQGFGETFLAKCMGEAGEGITLEGVASAHWNVVRHHLEKETSGEYSVVRDGEEYHDVLGPAHPSLYRIRAA